VRKTLIGFAAVLLLAALATTVAGEQTVRLVARQP